VTRRRDRLDDAPLLAWGDALRREKKRRARLRKRLALLGICAASVVLLAAHARSPRLIWNASASAPIGLYRVMSDGTPRIGDMVIARVPLAYRRLAAERHYLPADVPLVKRVAASDGQDVCAAGLGLFIDGRRASARRIVDGQGRPMPMWNGCIRLHARQYLLLMPDPASFDGRYFGITDGADIVGTATLLWQR
jgi:conjugative transfer signal peptidase TraF